MPAWEPVDIDSWERQRQEALASLMEALDADDVDLDDDPLAFAAHLDYFLLNQDYDELENDDWIWLQAALASYLAEVLIRKYGAYWRLIHDSRGPNYMLVARGIDGQEHEVSPSDVVHLELRQRPPNMLRIVANAELAASLTPTYDE